MSLATADTTTRSASSMPAPSAASEGPRFPAGATVVYPSHGVADVLEHEVKTVAGAQVCFYHLQVRGSGLKIIVPTVRAEENGMRSVAGPEDLAALAELLRVRDVPMDRQTWNRRYRGFMEKIRTGSLLEVAEVFRDLALLRAQKQLSHGEKQMLKTAKDLLVRELALSHGQSEDEVAEQLESVFKH